MPNCALAPAEDRPGLDQSTRDYLEALIRRFCVSDDLSTYDPYDIWKTALGFRVKNLYNSQPRLASMPAGLLALFDNVVNNRVRLFYTPAEYPIVRSLAALSVLNLYRQNHNRELLEHARAHLLWLLKFRCPGYNGLCWGLGFPHAAGKDLIYDRSTPFSTITPYALEAFLAFSQLATYAPFEGVIESILQFFEKDIQVMAEDESELATSYGPFRDRTVINAVSYTMYSYALLLPYASREDRSRIETKVNKLYAYIRRNQREDGSWLYSPHGRSFIDCFHSCIVLKNLIKTNRIMKLDGSQSLVSSGYEYLKRAFFNEPYQLFKRFSIKNKPGLIRFDLYDNAEVLNLAFLTGDHNLYGNLLASVVRHFCKDQDIYSQIDVIGIARNKNTLRWAVMPFLYAVSQSLS